MDADVIWVRARELRRAQRDVEDLSKRMAEVLAQPSEPVQAREL